MENKHVKPVAGRQMAVHTTRHCDIRKKGLQTKSPYYYKSGIGGTCALHKQTYCISMISGCMVALLYSYKKLKNSMKT